MIIWAQPEWLWGGVVIPLLIVAYWWRHTRHHASVRLSAFSHLPLKGRSSVQLRHLPFVIELLSLAAILLALARPQNSNHWETQSIQGIDLTLAMDISGSMLALDLEPNRFEAARSVATELIASRPNDNIGLVIFAGESFALCPLTTDHASLLELLSTLQVGQLEDGTAIGLGIATAVNTLRDSPSSSKVIILLTDGSNNAGDIPPSMATELAAQYGIRIYTVAAGTNGIAKVPVQTAYGTEIVDTEVVIDEKTLTYIAERTGGKFFRATDTQRLKEIYQEIDRLEKTRLLSRSVSAYEELYLLFAGIALLLLFVAFLLRHTLLRTTP